MRPILGKWSDETYALMRIVLGFLFVCYGSQKSFGFPGEPLGELSTFIHVGGAIELVGGLLIATGLLTSLAAFVCSGQMAVAYFMFHAAGGFWPTVNKGDSAVVYCFVFLYMAAKGSGIWSIDSLLQRGTRPR